MFKPNPKYAMSASTVPLSPIPKSAREALQDPNWRAVMQAEFDALLANNTWSLVDRPPNARIITRKWVFWIKLNSDGALNRYKARWVVCGFHQRASIDFTETFSLVIKSTTIRTVLVLIGAHSWPAHQLDVSNAFLHGNIEEQEYCQQPMGSADAAYPDAVCLLSARYAVSDKHYMHGSTASSATSSRLSLFSPRRIPPYLCSGKVATPPIWSCTSTTSSFPPRH